MLQLIKRNYKLFFLLLLIIIFTIPSVLGLLHAGFFVSDDGNWMVIRFSAFYQALRQGQFPVRFLFRLNNGYGYPVADFLYPLFMYLGVLIHILGFSFVTTIKIIFGLSLFFSSIFTLFWLRKLFDNLSSFIGALVYTFFPYHLFDVYTRGSIGEVLSLSILPFVLWQIERKNIFWISLGISLLILAHNTLAVLFLVLIFLYMSLDIFRSNNKKKLLIDYSFILFLGFGISSFFWLPAIFDLQYTVFSKTQVSSWNNYFLDFNLVGFLTIFVIFFTFTIVSLKKMEVRKKRLTFSFLILSLISIYLASSISNFFWKFLPVSFIQFPFRFLSLTIPCISFLAAVIVSGLSGIKRIVIVGLILFITYFSASFYLFPKNYQYYPDSFYSTNQDTTTIKNEYMPKWIKTTALIYKDMAVFIKGNGKIEYLSLNMNSTLLNIKALNDSVIQYNMVYFPGISLKIDEKSSKINYQDNGLINFFVPKGDHKITIFFGETSLRIISDVITIISLLMLLILVLKKKIYGNF